MIENKTKQAVGLDLGNGQVKIKTSTKQFMMPSMLLAAYRVSGELNLASGNTHLFQLVGEDEEKIWSDDFAQFRQDKHLETSRMESGRYDKKPFIRQLNFALALAATTFEPVETSKTEATIDGVKTVVNKKTYIIDFLSTGLPSGDFNDEGIGALIKLISGSHQVLMDGELIEIKVEHMDCRPQPVGTVLNAVLSDLGKMNLKEAQLVWGVMDIGSGTFLYDEIARMKFSPANSVTEYSGVSHLIEMIIKEAAFDKNQPVNDLSESGVIEALKNPTADGHYHFYYNAVDSVDITRFVNKMKKRYTGELIDLVYTNIKDLKRVDRKIVTGGGVHVIDKEAFKEAFPDIIFADESEYANVNGFYKAAVSRLLNNENKQIK